MTADSDLSDRPAPGSSALFILGAVVLVIVLAAAFGRLVENHIPPEEGGRVHYGVPPGTGGLAIGKPAPEIAAAGWLNGPAPTAEGLRGRVVVVEAWATWCGPCIARTPALIETYKKFEDRIVFVALTSEAEDQVPSIERFIKQLGVPWHIGYGADDALIALQADYIPRTWIIRDGVVFWNEESPQSLDAAIEEALKP